MIWTIGHEVNWEDGACLGVEMGWAFRASLMSPLSQ